MSNLTALYNDTLNQLRGDKDQRHFNEVFSEIRGAEFSMEDIGAIFIPNDSYLATIDSRWEEGSSCAYQSGMCMLTGEMIAPIKSVRDEVVGFVGFEPFIYADVHSGEGSGNYYIYHLAKGHKKSSFLYYPGDSFRDCLHSHLLVVDGVFDAISLTRAGYHAAALMGSTLSSVHRAIFDIVDNVILCMDNDDAGTKLAQQMTYCCKTVRVLKQPWTKDADECLKSEFRDQYIGLLNNTINFNR